MLKVKKTKKQPSIKQLEVRRKFAERARARGKQYTLTAKFNDRIFTCKTYNLDEAIVALKPINLKTKMLIRIEKEGKMFEKQLFVFPARQIFCNRIARKVFLNRLVFK